MTTRLTTSALLAAGALAVAGSAGPPARAGITIKEIVEDKGGAFKVGAFTFTFTDMSVTGDRKAEEVEVDAVGANGVKFTLIPGFRLDSNDKGSQTKEVGIGYTVTAAVPILSAGLDADVFSRFPENGASGGVTETTRGTEVLYVGSTPPATARGVVFGDRPMTLEVANDGRIFVPVRGPGPNQDEAQLTSITNTFGLVPEPASVGLVGVAAAGLLGYVRSRRRGGLRA